MKLFIDTANVVDIREAVATGLVYGVTTNPTLVAREGNKFESTIAEIASVVDGPVSAEVMGDSCDEMVREGIELSSLAPNVVIKVPATWEALKATKVLRARGIRTNVTLVFSPNQALAAARSGAAFVSPFVGRLDDVGADGMALIREISRIFELHSIETEIIAASIRQPIQVCEAAAAGAHIATVPFAVMKKMMEHPLTDIGIERFKRDWAAASH